MTGLRVLKAVTAYAFLVLITTAWVYKFNANGYRQTLDSLRASLGDVAYVFIAIFAVASLVSTPILGIAGIIGMAASKRLGRSALILGLLCCVLSFANLVLWTKYGGMPRKIPFCDWCNHP
jgi:hypothetical protein